MRFTKIEAKRLVACLVAGLMLAMMIGNQEGVQNDFGYGFRQSLKFPRVAIFLAIGLVLYVLITLFDRIRPYLLRPGIRPLFAGLLSVLSSFLLLHWTDSASVGDQKFGTISSKANATKGLATSAKLYFGSHLGWILLIAAVVLSALAIILSNKVIAIAGAVVAVVGGFWGYFAHGLLSDFLGVPDHSTGAWVALLGFLSIGAAALFVVLSKEDVAQTRYFANRLINWRPGLPLVVAGLIIGLISLIQSTWFAPNSRNATLIDTHNAFRGTGLAPLAVQYLIWLGWLLFIVTLLAAGAASYLRIRALGLVAAVIGAASILITLVTMYDFSKVAAQAGVDGATGPWQNLGVGGWLACTAFLLIGGGGYLAASPGRRPATAVSSDVLGSAEPKQRQVADTKAAISTGLANGRTLLFVVLAVALFYPPMANGFWQKALVTDIGIYVLLAVGLNVVVGWAGLLDLGFIAFYAIGSYMTAYLTYALPHRPPSWLHLSPLWAIPFAIVACLIAGVALGAPTLRLRGDYLAIVTLGFGEIIRLFAVNNPGNITNGPKGAFGIPNPVIHIGPLKLVWGQNQLQYWYLLLVLVVIIVVLFNRLENSRLGRAWAAVREDEVAAQATGINTTRVKLLAFAIGASTSGVAGVFFASQIGYINPDNFVLNNSFLVVAYVVFGGMGSLPGAMAGAAALTWLPDFLKDQVPASDRYMWVGAILVVMMIFRPEGLIPARRRRAELSGLDAPASAEARAVPASEGL
ncbi:MAG TPA: branched-chain amino acid ABC transporter permease [Jatrophihabitans sp.]|nr:branched-chain amino acid ABC transporter permease [Jatrophihabitans sp.]